MRTIRISEKATFITYLNKGVTLVSDNVVDMGINTASFNTTYKSLRINDGDTLTKGTLDIPLGKLNLGDTVEVEYEGLNVSGANARCGLDIFSNAEYTQVIVTGVGDNEFLESDSFTMTNQKILVTKNGYGKLSIGTWTGLIGDNHIRNINIKINSCRETIESEVHDLVLSKSDQEFKGNKTGHINNQRVYKSNGGGAGLFSYNNDEGMVTLYAVDTKNPQNYILAIGYKKPNTVHTLSVVANNVLTLGAKNAGGTQVIDGGVSTDIVSWATYYY